MTIILPNFLIVGAAKSGTTSLYSYAKEHPEIFMSKEKEPRFFISSICSTLSNEDPRRNVLQKYTSVTYDHYVNLFKEATNYKVIGEASASYLYNFQTAIPNIKTYLKNPNIIICLRNPIDRAFSAYTYLVRDQYEVLSFEKCLELESERKAKNWSMINFYKDAGCYYRQVKAYLDNFNHVKIYIYEELDRNALGLAKNMYEFLGVSPSFIPDTRTRYNVSGIPKNKHIHTFLTESNILKKMLKPLVNIILPKEKREKIAERIKARNLMKPAIKPETRAYLITAFREDILKLQDLIGENLTHWLD